MHIPHFLACENFPQKILIPQNDKKEIENVKTSKYQNKILSKFSEKNKYFTSPPCETSN
jgi:hypothetical protein